MARPFYKTHLTLKRWFFDRQEVLQKLGKARAKALSKAGAFVRQRARSLLRRRKKPAPPGHPPHVHTRDDLASLRAIFFTYEPYRDQVLVGPIKLNAVDYSADGPASPVSGAVPGLHEHGGALRFREELAIWRDSAGVIQRRWRRADQRTRRVRNREAPQRYRTARYPPRPFMRPALEQEIAAGNVLGPWADSVVRS